MTQYFPKKIIVEKNLQDNHVVLRVLSRVPQAQVVFQDNVIQDPKEKESTLYLTINPGRYFKPCPKTPIYVCCDYQILNFSTGCPIQCTYCILNGYFETRSMRFFCDHEKMLSEVDASLQARKTFTRIGSGEFTDSLILDHLTDFTCSTVPFFLSKRNVLFEIKTKTSNIDNLLNFKPKKRIVVSWSVNPENIQDTEEKNSATLEERIEAARKCQEQGYLIGFHFDPIIKHTGWEENYCKVVDLIYQNINPDNIAWISLGCFRFVPLLKDVIQLRYPGTRIIYEEFVLGRDGKMRYFRPIREIIYPVIVERIRTYHKNPPVYFCMETPVMWERIMGKKTFSSDSLCALLDEVKSRFKL